MNVVVREAVEADLEQVLALYETLESMPGPKLELHDAQAIFAQFGRYPSYRLWVACDSESGELVGSYALLVMHNLGHRGTPSAVVEDVVVAADRQRQGIGRRMMEHALQQARAAGCYKLALSSNDKRVDAHAFYESLGLARHGVSFMLDSSKA